MSLDGDKRYGARDSRRTMADGRYDLARLPKLVRERDVDRVNSKIDDGPVSANVKDRVVLGRVDVLERDRGCQLAHDGLILEELLRFIVRKGLHRVFIYRRVRARRGSKVDVKASVGEGVVGVRSLGKIPALLSATSSDCR